MKRTLRIGVPLGLAVGVLSGLLGIGGGALLIAGLIYGLGFRQHAAHATSLAAIILTAAAAVVPFALAGLVSVEGTLALAPTAIAGAFLGAGLMRRLPEDRLRQLFAVFLLLVAARMAVGVTETAVGVPEKDAATLAGLALLGLVAGGLSAVMGVGGGMIMVPAMVLLFAFSQQAAEGTSLAVVIPTALVGAWRHTRSGYTDWRIGMLLGASGIAGGLAGGSLAIVLPELVLQRVFAVFLLVMAVQLLRRPRRQRDGDAAGDEDE